MSKHSLCTFLTLTTLDLMLTCSFPALASESSEQEAEPIEAAITEEEEELLDKKITEDLPDNLEMIDILCPSEQELTDVLNRFNEERNRLGVASLSMDVTLHHATDVRAKESSSRFEHVRTDGSPFYTAVTDVHVPFKHCGEILACHCKSSEQVVETWFNSPPHYEAIVSSKYTHISISHYINENGKHYWAAIMTAQV